LEASCPQAATEQGVLLHADHLVVRASAVRNALELAVPGGLERRYVTEISMAQCWVVRWPWDVAREDSRARREARDSNSAWGQTWPEKQGVPLRRAWLMLQPAL